MIAIRLISKPKFVSASALVVAAIMSYIAVEPVALAGVGDSQNTWLILLGVVSAILTIGAVIIVRSSSQQLAWAGALILVGLVLSYAVGIVSWLVESWPDTSITRLFIGLYWTGVACLLAGSALAFLRPTKP